MKKHTQESTTFVLLFMAFWVAVILWQLPKMVALPKYATIGCPPGNVCLPHKEFERITKHGSPMPTLSQPSYTRDRDIRVLDDPLYPALNRTNKDAFEGVAEHTLRRNFNVPTQRSYDTYRLVGYMTNDDDELGKWKVFGRQKDRNRGDFYMVPVNRQHDMKVQITDSMMVGEKMRDVDTLPNSVTFNSPLLAKTPYTFTELPKADLTDEVL
jgi:hypothetical protein